MSTRVGPASPAPTLPTRFRPWRRELRSYVELLAVTAMAIARPTLGILSNNSAIFVTRQTSPAELIGLVLLLVLAPPLVLWLVEVGISLVVPRARRIVHAALIATVAGFFLIPMLKHHTGLGSVVIVGIAVVAVVAGGWVVWRFEVARLFLRYLAIAPVLFVVLFFTSSSVQSAVFEPDPGAFRVEVDRPERIVMVVLDELPEISLLDGQGGIDEELFPNFAALASTSTWYRNATTVAPYTGAALPAILTGRYKTGDSDAQVAARAPENLFTLLGDTYSMNVEEGNTRLCPADLCSTDDSDGGAGRRLWELLSISRTLWWENTSPERVRVTLNPFDDGDILGDPAALATGERFVASLQPAQLPQLDLLHVLLPHQRWHYLPDGEDYLEETAAPGLFWDFTWGSEWVGRLARQRHRLQVATSDRLLGDIVARLKRIGAYDDTLLIVTADHGIAFDARQPIRGVSSANAPDILWVPMLVKAPRQTEPMVDDRPAKTIDLLPTVADHIGVNLPWRVDGRSLLGRPRAERPLKVHDWGQNVVEADARGFAHVAAATNFARVLDGRASDQDGLAAQRLYRIGPYGDLLGRDADAFTGPANDDSRTVELDDPARFQSVDPRSREVPWTYIKGTIRGDVPPDAPLAITVNGIVGGLSGTFLDPLEPDQLAFWGMLDPEVFRRGQNDVGVAVIEGSPDAPELVPLRMTR